MSQNFGLYGELSVVENVRFYASLYGIKDEDAIQQLLQTYQIDQFKAYKAGKLSGGYKRRLSLVCALVHNPDVIFLDEPTAGIDLVTRKELWDLFFKLSAEGKTLFVTTHYMEEAERCNRIAFLNHGKLVTVGNPQRVKNALSDVISYAYYGDFELEMIDVLKKSKGIVLVNQFGKTVNILIDKQLDKIALQALIKPFIKQEPALVQREINLEDVFIVMTQDETR